MNYQPRYKRKLPHLQPQGGILFITFRLNFPIPKHFIQEYLRYRDVLAVSREKSAKNEAQAMNDTDASITRKKLFALSDGIYDRCSSEVLLTKPEAIATILSDKLLALQNSLYYLFAYTIMPNHVHLLIKPLLGEQGQIPVAEIMRRIKGGTARQMNLILGREGTLWFREYYDHWVRDYRELMNIVEYIRQNPVKARLVKDPEEWKWTWINPEMYDDE